MKQVCTIILFFALSMVNIQAQQISNKNWTFVHERTASWCPFCGTWGWTFKDSVLNKFTQANVIFTAVHHSGDLINQTATEMDANFGGSGQPIFYVDGFNINVNSGNINQKLSETQLELDFKASTAVIAGVGIDAVLSTATNTLSVNAKVEFLNPVEGGDYYLGLYLLEDVQNIQASRSGVQLHKNVLRRSLLPTTFGNALKAGAISKGTTFSVTTSTSSITTSRDKIKVVGILWNKVNNKFLFFNANQVNVGIPASSSDDVSIGDFKVYQAESGVVMINLKNINTEKGGVINIIDVSGKIVATRSISKNDIGTTVQISEPFAPGMHIVTFTSEKQKTSRKILIH